MLCYTAQRRLCSALFLGFFLGFFLFTMLQTPAQALILAAGRGARMRPLSDQCPKPLLSVLGQPMLARHSDALAAQGFGSQLINAAWLHEQIEQFVADAWANASDRQVHISNEGRDFGHALETLGGIARVLPQLDEVFWVVAGDIYAPDFVYQPQLYAEFAASADLARVFLVPNPSHKPIGDFVLSADGRLRNVPEAAAAGAGLTFSTIALYKKAAFALPSLALPAGNPDGVAAPLAPLLRHLAEQDLASASRYDGRWVDVGTPERLAALNAAGV